MAFARVKVGGWAVHEILTSAQMNALDIDHANAVDKTSAGDTMSGLITMAGVGRFLPTTTTAPDVDTTISVGTASIWEFGAAITANRTFTFSNTSAQTGDVITLFANTSLAFPVTIRNAALATIWQLGPNQGDDGAWADFIFRGGAWEVERGGQGSRLRLVSLVTNGTFAVPRGVGNLLLTGYGGGGGGGGGATATTSTGQFATGGGGGAGAMVSTIIVSVTPGTTYNITIGAFGAGGNAGNPGTAGGDTIFDTGTNKAVFKGGRGGSQGQAAGASQWEFSLGGGFAPQFFSGSYASATPVWAPVGPHCGGFGVTGSGSLAASNGGDGIAGMGGSYVGGAGGGFGAVSGSYNGGGGGGGGGAGPGGSGFAGTSGGAANNAGNGSAGTGGGHSAGNTGAGGGGGGAGGYGSGGGGVGAAGINGDAGELIIVWVK